MVLHVNITLSSIIFMGRFPLYVYLKTSLGGGGGGGREGKPISKVVLPRKKCFTLIPIVLSMDSLNCIPLSVLVEMIFGLKQYVSVNS